MGIFDFVKDAGERIFGGDKPERPKAAEVDAEFEQMKVDREKREALTRVVQALDLDIDDFELQFSDGEAIVKGTAPSQEVREKIVLVIGNTQGVARVDDRITIEKPEPEARMHTVVSGDSLSKIAKQYYGDAMKYPVIFEANTPMLKNPDRIYPGQVLRIPPLD